MTLQGGRQNIGINVGAAYTREIFYIIDEFPYVAGERVLQHSPAGFRRELERDTQGVFKCLQKQRNVLLTFPQRRNDKGKGIQPIEEIFPEGTGRDQLLQIPIAGGDKAHIHMDDFVAADPHHFLFLDDTQQLYLQTGAHPLDLVQQQGAVVGKFKQTQLAAFFGAGKGALFLSEELALQKCIGDGGAVDGQKRSVPAEREVVDGLGEELLARAAFPHNEYGQIGQSHLLSDLLGLLNGGAVPQV